MKCTGTTYVNICLFYQHGLIICTNENMKSNCKDNKYEFYFKGLTADKIDTFINNLQNEKTDVIDVTIKLDVIKNILNMCLYC